MPDQFAKNYKKEKSLPYVLFYHTISRFGKRFRHIS